MKNMMNIKELLSPAELARYIKIMKRKNPNFDIDNEDGIEAAMEKEERLLRLGRKIGLVA